LFEDLRDDIGSLAPLFSDDFAGGRLNRAISCEIPVKYRLVTNKINRRDFLCGRDFLSGTASAIGGGPAPQVDISCGP
jgi:hypothetical protein